jgi:hypothetical protein
MVRMSRPRCRIMSLLSIVVLGCLWNADSVARAPHLYARTAYQSPVRGDPDDLLVLAGDALSADVIAVYQAYTSEIPEHPKEVPSDSSPLSGVAPIVSALGAPYQLAVHLPANMLDHHSYRIWIRSPLEGWSNGVSINDARPLWFSPSTAYATTQMAGLPRSIKVIGRNMLASGNRLPAIRLVGRTSYRLQVAPDEPDNPVRQTYVVKRRLPKSLEPGQYRVELQTGETTWTAVPGQTFTVRADPSRANEFSVSDGAYGSCRPDDGQDDTDCTMKAIEAARRAGGGTVVFERGTWTLASGALVVPPNVELHGRGDAVTRVVRSKQSRAAAGAEFVLLGHNTVSGISFADEATSEPHSVTRPILQIGRRYNTDVELRAEPAMVADVIITENVFDKTDGAVVDSGNPIERLYITYNQFGDYRLGLNLGGNRYNVRSRFGITDAVIAYNRFMPGSYLDLELAQGAIASEVGASRRMDFSSNVADGASHKFLYSDNDAPGWRAAFFWHMNDNHEMLLISENSVTCSGDKDGDGEAISLDSNANTFGLSKSELVLHASQDSVNVKASLKTSQNNRSVDVDSYYIGHWLRVDSGPGIGQSRRIVASRRTGDMSDETSLLVEPPWDVTPEQNVSTVSVAREYWQAMIIDNAVDQRKPLCLKSNRTRPKGGNISVWGQNADTVVEGNHQFDTDGIVFEQRYGADDAACPDCKTMTSMPAFLEIRNNLIEGEYDWASACSLSGITGSYSASPSPHSLPPLLGVGISISHNRITHADSLHGGAISIVPTWFSGPPGYGRPLLEGLTIHHNLIQNISGPAPRADCGYAQGGRYGINLQGEKYVDGTVLYRNVCVDVTNPLRDHGVRTKRLCDIGDAKSCECTNGN